MTRPTRSTRSTRPTRRPRSIATTAAALAAALSLGVAAPADAATHSVEELSFTNPAQRQLTEACGYDVSFTLTGSWNVVSFHDDSGALVREIRNLRFEALIEANGRAVRGWARGPEIRTFSPDGTELTYVELGVVGRHLKGGNVMQKVGRAVYQLDPETGELDLVFESAVGDDLALVCAGLDPV